MRIITILACTQGTFEVEEFSDRGFGATFEVPNGQGRKLVGGRGQGPRPPKIIDCTHLQSFLS